MAHIGAENLGDRIKKLDPSLLETGGHVFGFIEKDQQVGIHFYGNGRVEIRRGGKECLPAPFLITEFPEILYPRLYGMYFPTTATAVSMLAAHYREYCENKAHDMRRPRRRGRYMLVKIRLG